MKEKRLQKLAKKLVALELKAREGNSEQVMEEISKLCEGLSVEDMFYIDDYIMEKGGIN